MKILQMPQGSQEWHIAKLGIPSASNFDKIITPGGKASASAVKYQHRLLAERLLRQPVEDVHTAWMDRGTGLEPDARRYYELQRDMTVQQVGFLVHESGRYGASPDALVGEAGLLEIKCPTPPVHVGYLLSTIGDEYKPQIQGQLLVSGREWVDFLSFNPDLPPALVRVHRDEKFIASLQGLLEAFCDVTDGNEALLRGRLGLKEVAA